MKELKPQEVEDGECSGNPLDSDANPKRQIEETLAEAQSDISPTQHRCLQKKMPTAKTIQEMMESLKVLIAENASLQTKIENTKKSTQENEINPAKSILHNNKNSMQE